MMKNFLICSVLIATAITLSGCFVKSLHPTYLDASIVHDFDAYQSFQPLMKDKSPSKAAPWKRSGNSFSTYLNGTASDRLRTVFFNVGKSVYLDVTPESTSSEDASIFHLIPAHCLHKVTVTGDLFQVNPLRTSSLTHAIKNKSVTLSHLLQNDAANNDLIVTASPEEWKKFLETNGDTELFVDDEPLFFRGSMEMPKP
jgi:hypothetical protein